MTHAYFCLYHSLANLLIRRARAALAAHGAVAQARTIPRCCCRHPPGRNPLSAELLARSP